MFHQVRGLAEPEASRPASRFKPNLKKTNVAPMKITFFFCYMKLSFDANVYILSANYALYVVKF